MFQPSKAFFGRLCSLFYSLLILFICGRCSSSSDVEMRWSNFPLIYGCCTCKSATVVIYKPSWRAWFNNDFVSETYCRCAGAERGKMTCCKNEACTGEWFQLACATKIYTELSILSLFQFLLTRLISNFPNWKPSQKKHQPCDRINQSKAKCITPKFSFYTLGLKSHCAQKLSSAISVVM